MYFICTEYNYNFISYLLLYAFSECPAIISLLTNNDLVTYRFLYLYITTKFCTKLYFKHEYPLSPLPMNYISFYFFFIHVQCV